MNDVTRRPVCFDSWRIWCCTLLALCAGCAHQAVDVPRASQLPPLETQVGELSPREAAAGVTTPELLALTDDMREFVDQYIYGGHHARLRSLHQSLRSPAFVGVHYDPLADGTAAQVYHSGAANCLSFANLFVAMARYAGLEAQYQATSIRPEWSRHGNQIALRQHVNVAVRLPDGVQYVVDIDPLSRDRVISADLLDDREAFALYHGNRAMAALRDSDLPAAYAQAVKAISLGRDIDYLWVNLGIIYRHAGQDEAAELAYRTALAINPDSSPAMNNMAVLYRARGEPQLAREWERKVERRRKSNPYYYYFQGRQSEDAGELGVALSHYASAIDLQPSDAEFHYRIASVYFALEQREMSRRHVLQAIKLAQTFTERAEYRALLRKLDGGEAVSAGVGQY